LGITQVGAHSDGPATVTFVVQPAPDALPRVRAIVRDHVAQLGGDSALGYAAQLAVSETVSAMFEGRTDAVELATVVTADGLEIHVTGHTNAHRLDEGALRRRLIDASAEHVSIRREGRTQTVSLRFGC
jgi:hypothetical protein